MRRAGLMVFLVGVPGLGSPGDPAAAMSPTLPDAGAWRSPVRAGAVSGILVHDHEGLSSCGELSGNIAENSP
jgi:hypothetical protein